MANGKLVFPVRFDLESAVRAASGDVDRVLSKLQTSIHARPLRLGINIDQSAALMDAEGNIKAATGSITAMRAEMKQLIDEWNKLSEAERITSQVTGVYTAEAQKLLNRYGELVAASESYAKSLVQIASDAKRATDAEIKRTQKALAEQEKRRQTLAAEETSLGNVIAKIRVYQQVAERNSFGSKAYRLATYHLERLGTQYERLKEIMNSKTGNMGKDSYNTEKLVRNLGGAESSIAQVQEKLKALSQLLILSEPNTEPWKTYADQHARLTEKLENMKAVQQDAVKTETQLREERERAAREELENQRRVKASRTQTNSEIERERQARQTLIAQKRKELTLLNGEEKTIDQVNAKLRIRQEIAQRTDPNSSAFRRNADEIIRLNGVLDEYNRKFRETTASPINMAKIDSMPEKTISDLTAKIQAYRNVMQGSDFGSVQFAQAALSASSLTTKLEQMNKVISEQEKWRVFQEALKASSSSIEGLNTLLSAWQTRMRSLDIGSKLWLEAAANVAKYSSELQKATQYAQDFQQKAFQGLGSSFLQRQVEQTRQLRMEIQNCDEMFNRLHSAGRALDNSGNLTPAAVNILQEKAIYTKMLAELTLDSDKALQKYEESERKAAQATKQRADALKKMRDALGANEQRITGLNDKLQLYQSLIQKQQVGSEAWNKSALEIRRITEELAKANQQMQDFQQKAFQGLGDALTKGQVERLTKLREDVRALDAQLHELYQNKLNNNGQWAGPMDKNLFNSFLKQRADVTKQINEMLKSGADFQLEREKKITEETEKRRKLLEDMRRKEKEHDTAKGERRALAIAEQRRKAAYQLTKDEKYLTQEQQKRLRILNAEENTINNIQKKLAYYQQKLSGQIMDSAGFKKTAAEIERLTKALDEAQKNIDRLTGKKNKVRDLSQEFQNQTTYVERLIKRMMVYASYGMIVGFLSKIREVTAQFELQRISLGAIIQDQNKANQLFSEIKQFALKSPVSILDMTKYTKQVAAYRIETDKLFDTTKRLADVSVGLGVDMSRIVLAYGQVRAASFLRASELRQFTEAGIPMLDLLAEKFTQLEGRMVSAEDVMQKIKKRGVEFAMVEEIFNDMTSAGGMFYNMQEKQGNTLYGMWAKLGDAASMMYDDIGNTNFVNSSMKGIIDISTELMKNWRTLAVMGGGLIVCFGVYKTATALSVLNTVAATKATDAYTAAQERLNLAVSKGTKEQRLAAMYALRAAAANQLATKSANALTAIKYRLIGVVNNLKAVLIGNWLTALVAVVAAIGTAFYNAYEKAHKLDNALADIRSETSVLQAQSVRNFEYLAQKAISAADGSKAQKDALDELNRTYKDMLPEEALKIENLRKIKDNYDELTQSIREYIAMQQKEKALNTLNEEEGAAQVKMEKVLRGKMTDKKLGNIALSDIEVDRFFMAFRETAQDTSLTIQQQFIKAFRQAGLKGGEAMWDEVKKLTDTSKWYNFNNLLGLGIKFSIGKSGWFNSEDEVLKSRAAVGELARSYEYLDRRTAELNEDYSHLTAALGEYTQAMQDHLDYVEKNMNSGETFLQNQENVNMQIKDMESRMRQELTKVGITWQKGWSDIVNSVDPKNLNQVSMLNVEAILSAIDPKEHSELYRLVKQFQKIYYDLVPQDATVQQIRAKLMSLSQAAGVSMDVMRRFLWNGSGDIKAHLKTLNEQIDEYKASLKKMQTTYANMGIFGTIANSFLKGEIEETKKIIEILEKHAKFVETYDVPDKKKNKDRHSDPRLQTLQDIANKMAEINREYDDLLKKEGQTKALTDTQTLFTENFKEMEQTAKKFGFRLPVFEVPQTVADVQKWYNAIIDNIKRLNLKNADKAIIELGFKRDKAAIDKQQKDIENELKRLSERISRTKTARDFFEKLLTQTGDIELSVKLTTSIYGEKGDSLNDQIRNQIETLVGRTSASLDVNIFHTDNSFDPKKLRAFAEAEKEALGGITGEVYKELIKLSNDAEKDFAKTVEEWLKATEKAKTYSDKLLDLRRKTQQETERINRAESQGKISPEFAEAQRNGFMRKEAEETARLQYEAFKDTPLYVQMFDSLDHASTTMLRNMRDRMEELKISWKNLSPSQLKEIQSRLNEIDEQLTRRSPFKTLSESIREYYRLRKNGDEFGNKSKKDADASLAAAARIRLEAEQRYLDILNDEKATQQQISEAKNKFDQASENEAAAAKAVENWKKIKDIIGLSANELIQMMGWTGDVAHGIADISETLGADTETVQYWNDVAGAIDDIAGGIQDIVSAVMNGNVVGVVSAMVTALPKMFVGFSNLFYAGRIKKANKEIKKQQELLNQLEYTYSRLENAAEKALGSDYLTNLRQRQRQLEAQAEAYRKQADAEREKGKKADKEKIKDYETSWRNVLDEIADMQGELSAKMLGTDLASAARDFAQAWLEAYKEFANTSNKMSEKFRDMVENMVVESALARVMERALRPMFDMIDSMKEEDFYSQDFWRRVVTEAEKGADAANAGAGTMMKFLEQAGVSVRDLGTNLTGITREYANASEETISGLTAATNTQNFYVSQISGEVQVIRRLLESGVWSSGENGQHDKYLLELTELERRSVETLNMIERHTAETATECRRAAAACEEQVKLLWSVTESKGGNLKLKVKM